VALRLAERRPIRWPTAEDSAAHSERCERSRANLAPATGCPYPTSHCFIISSIPFFQTFFATTNQPVPFFVRLHISSRALRQMPEFNTVSQNSEVISLRNLGSNRYMLARHPAEMGGTKLELEQQMSRVLEWEFGGQKRRNLVIHLGV
jgi:hypothetical protein